MVARPLLAGAALLSAIAAGAAAQDSPEGAAEPREQAARETAIASPAAPTDADAEKKICHTEKVTGSLSRRNRICLTAAQWREIYDRTRRGVGEMTSAASGGKECIIDEAGGCRVTF